MMLATGLEVSGLVWSGSLVSGRSGVWCLVSGVWGSGGLVWVWTGGIAARC